MPFKHQDGLPISPLIETFTTALKKNDENAIADLINDIFQCEFNNPPSLSNSYVRKINEHDQFNYIFALENIHVVRFCTKLGLPTSKCLKPKLLNEICQTFPKRLIMDQNILIGETEKFLSSNELQTSTAFKVILLVRDPRGVVNSRELLRQCDSQNVFECVDVPKLCLKLDADAKTGKEHFLYKVLMVIQ